VVSVAFVVTCVLIVVAPGPSFAVMVNQSLRNGRLGGLAAVLGNASGLVFWASASVFGLTALIRTSEFAFVALKVVGAAYLCWLGLRTLVRSRATDPAGQLPDGLLVVIGHRQPPPSWSALQVKPGGGSGRAGAGVGC
jgi:threonine/homoserine/homoserine lactone efflux protein